MPLKCKRATAQECLSDITPGPAPKGMLQHAWNRSRPQNQSSELGWYRGKIAGRIDAVLTLQEMGHARIAAKLQHHFGLIDDCLIS